MGRKNDSDPVPAEKEDADKQSEKPLPLPTVEESDEDDVEAGPMPPKALKRRKVLEFQSLYLDSLPCATMYERSYMHVGEVNHVRVTKTDFFITSSVDGQLKFWKKKPKEIEFVKRFYAHVGPITDMAVTPDGLWLCTVGSKDKNLNIFDVVNFDMINMISLEEVPACCEWVHAPGTNQLIVAVGSSDTPAVRLYDARSGGGKAKAMREITVHRAPVTVMRYHAGMGAVLSHSSDGHLELWDPVTGALPAAAAFRFKSDTDLYELARHKTTARSLNLGPDGDLFACICADKQVRVWRCSTGKLVKKIDEGAAAAAASQAEGPLKLDTLDYGRRMALEKEMDTAKPDPDRARPNAVFDQSGRLLMYTTSVGIKVVNLVENRVVRVLGKPESNERFLGLALYQGHPNKGLHGTDHELDPVLLATSHAKSRFFLFTRREPDQSSSEDGAGGRDVFNERPPKELTLSGVGPAAATAQLGRGATIHTTMGDMHVRLFAEECPKTVENFCTHARNEYYNGVLFHRVIKSFMVQTGDPLGDGTGGTSIWGREFEDEFHRNLRHDRPFTLSMANAGPNTNGSQFFITTVPTPWLDNKHTVFGRVVKGMDVVQMIEAVKCSKDDKPVEDIKIVNIRITATAPSAK